MAGPGLTVRVELDGLDHKLISYLETKESLAALKVLVGDLTITEKRGRWDELYMLKVIGEKDPQSLGYRHLCQLLDNFTHQGPNGNLVLEAMSLNALDVYRAVLSGPMPLPFLKRVSKHVLRALQYLHEYLIHNICTSLLANLMLNRFAQ